MQLNLNLTDLPLRDDRLWEQLDQTTREEVIERLAQAIVKIMAPNVANQPESNHE